MEVFLLAFLHIVYTSDKKMQLSKTKPWKNMIIYGYRQSKEKGELIFGLFLALDLGDLPEKSLFLSYQICEIPQKSNDSTSWCHAQHPWPLGNSCLV